jgi:hypothetical protein
VVRLVNLGVWWRFHQLFFIFYFVVAEVLSSVMLGFLGVRPSCVVANFGVFRFNERLDRDFWGFLFFKPNIYDGLRNDKLGEGIGRIQIN